MATVEKQTHFVSNIATARHGNSGGVRHPSNRLEISTGGLFASRHGSDFFWNRPDRRDDSGGGVTQITFGHLDCFAHGRAEKDDALHGVAADLCADVSIGQRHGGV